MPHSRSTYFEYCYFSGADLRSAPSAKTSHSSAVDKAGGWSIQDPSRALSGIFAPCVVLFLFLVTAAMGSGVGQQKHSSTSVTAAYRWQSSIGIVLMLQAGQVARCIPSLRNSWTQSILARTQQRHHCSTLWPAVVPCFFRRDSVAPGSMVLGDSTRYSENNGWLKERASQASTSVTPLF